MKVFITPVERHDWAWTDDASALLALAEKADPHEHQIVNSPEDAGVILITDLRDTEFMSSLRTNAVLRSYPDKCFVVSNLDRPIGLVRGIYTCIPRSTLTSERFRAGFYLTEGNRWKNPFVCEMAEKECDLDIFFSFFGRSSAPCRAELLAHKWRRDDIVVEDPAYDHWDLDALETPGRLAQQRYFAEIASRSGS